MSGAGRRARSSAASRQETPRRRWGAHELTPAWARRIVAAATLRPGSLVLDLGAGCGALSEPLVRNGHRVVAAELHPGRAAALRDRLGDDLTIVEQDMLDMPLPTRSFDVVANPPYGIAVALVRRLAAQTALRSAHLVLPRWQVNRHLARPPRHCHVAIGLHVPAEAFRPAPRNDSAVLVMRRHARPRGRGRHQRRPRRRSR